MKYVYLAIVVAWFLAVVNLITGIIERLRERQLWRQIQANPQLREIAQHYLATGNVVIPKDKRKPAGQT